MYRRFLVGCLAAIGALLHFSAVAGAQPRPAGEGALVIMKARLYEVDEAFYQKIAKAKWRSQAELEELEEKPSDGSLFALVKKQKPFLLAGKKEIRIAPGKESLFLTATKPIHCLPTPDQLRQGKKLPQTIEEGFTLSVQVQLSADKRFVRARFLEKSLEIEGIEKVKVLVDLKGTEAVGELVFAQESSFSQARYICDGGSMPLLLNTRPRAVRKNGRWLVAEISPRIYIAEEERTRPSQAPK